MGTTKLARGNAETVTAVMGTGSDLISERLIV
jgi:hypothetical protein